ncbi:SIS domain-containing protein [Jannaschia rubra]|uniref:3-hexulose-6-phosphate isomerase n=1 Tax=Jannaschia rubra TaxID=282197 RepID=A0A0M6XUF3_9RHOB|nr:SIS domain-containing protein [Jannaschia rubra]CTQ34730.1 3-hexulose-6-phosphate isomerase [Jannaschia rubra]SFG69258.1 3-hexulose-6-phosphate isomerase [Jannaschia rubra]
MTAVPLSDRARSCAQGIVEAAGAVDPADHEAAIRAIARARRIACTGVGREGLMMRALAMRLFHLGRDAHVVGDMTVPPLGPGDLLMVSAGPGDFGTVRALVQVARDAGAATLALTAQPGGAVARMCDTTVVLPARTMAEAEAVDASALPMGSVYEGALFLWSELLVLDLARHLGQGPGDMRARHTNLE